MKYLKFLALFFLLSACKSDKTNDVANSEQPTDQYLKELIESPDQSFLNFFDSFMWIEEFQRARTNFPIQYDGKTYSKEEWQYLPFTSKVPYEVVIFNDTLKYNDITLDKNRIVLSIFDFDSEHIRNFTFENKEKRWFLSQMKTIEANKHIDYEFIDFITQFSKDSLFQMEHIQFPLIEISLEEIDSDYEEIQRNISIADWRYIPILIGEKEIQLFPNKDNKEYKTILYRGTDSGMTIIYEFRKIDSIWKLVRVLDYSNL